MPQLLERFAETSAREVNASNREQGMRRAKRAAERGRVDRRIEALLDSRMLGETGPS